MWVSEADGDGPRACGSRLARECSRPAGRDRRDSADRHRLDDHRPPAHRPRGRPAGVDRGGQERPPHRLRPHLARQPDHQRHERADRVREGPARWIDLCLERRRHGRGAGPRRHAVLRGKRSGEPELHGVGDRHAQLPRRACQRRRERGHVVVVRRGQLCDASEHHDLPHPHERAGEGLPRRALRLHDRTYRRQRAHGEPPRPQPADPRLLRSATTRSSTTSRTSRATTPTAPTSGTGT